MGLIIREGGFLCRNRGKKRACDADSRGEEHTYKSNPEAGCLYLGRGKTMEMQDLLRWVLWNHLRGSLLGSDRYHG